MLNDLWKRLGGVMTLRTLTIEGEGGGAGGGADAGAGGGAPASGGGAGAAAGSGGGSTPAAAAPPAAAPATAVSSGAGAPADTQAVSSTLTDDTGKPVRELGESSEAFLARFRAHQKANPPAAEPAAKTPEQLAAEAAAAGKGAAAETPEQKAARERAAAVAAETPEQKTAREKKEADDRAAAAAQAQPGGEDYDLAPIPTETLAAAIKAHPAETKAFLDATGLTEDQLFANSRLAGMTGEFMKAGLGTVEAAKHAVARAKAFHHLDDSFTSLKPGDVVGTGKFLNDVLLPLSYLRDENGQVRVDPETKMPLTDGSVFTFLDNAIGVKFDHQSRMVERDGEAAIGHVFGTGGMAKLMDAVDAYGKKLGGDKGDAIRAAVSILKGSGKAAMRDEDLPPEVKERLAAADREKAAAQQRQTELDQRQTAEYQQRITTFKEETLGESSQAIDKIIDGFLDKTSLNGETFVRPAVIAKIRKALYDNMSSDELYLSQREAVTIGGPTPATRKAWVALNVGEAKARLKTVADPILAEAGVKKMSAAEERRQQLDGQQRNSRMEPQGGTTVALPRATAELNPHELIAKARENLRSRGEEITTESLLAERRKLMAGTAA